MRHSPFNLIVVTEDEAGVRTLRFGQEGVPQSVLRMDDPSHLELPYTTVLPLCLAFIEKPLRILIVGLGAGVLPNFFHKQLPEAVIEVVEIDREVLEIAKTYFGFQEQARMCVHLEDGRDFIERCHGCYDMIVLDSFNSESVPPHLLTIEFLGAVRNALAPGGIAVANVWGRTFNRLYDHTLLTYREAFEDIYVFDVTEAGTKIFIALPAKHHGTRESLLGRIREVSTTRGLYPYSAEMLGRIRNSELERCRGGAVLRDQPFV
ncbi:MAG: fused MFS/spermidine synthase [Verrucomicrobiota bacterium]